MPFRFDPWHGHTMRFAPGLAIGARAQHRETSVGTQAVGDVRASTAKAVCVGMDGQQRLEDRRPTGACDAASHRR